MNSIDLSKPVKFRAPEPGEEDLIFKVTNFNEVTNRCYISPINLKGFEGISPEELVSVDDLVNVEVA